MQSPENPPSETCLWCSHTLWMKDHVNMVTKWMGSPHSSQPAWFQQMSKDLSNCSDCVVQFHTTMKLFCSNYGAVYKWNCSRICGYLKEALLEYSPEGFIDDDTYYNSMRLCIEAAVKEILKYPRLMLNRQLHTLALKSIKILLKSSQGFELQERLQGLCILLVSQDSKISFWALKAFKAFGSISCDEYEELEDVIDWLLGVITFNLFVNQVHVDESTMWDETQNVVLPHYLFTPQPRVFWLAICSVLNLMTKDCIQTQFLTTDLKHKELVESILMLLDKDSDNDPTHSKPLICKNTVFWPALQCFVLLLDKLGSRFWMFTRTAPNAILKLIKSNAHYQEQLEICYSEAARFEIPDIEDNFTFSQLVFDDDSYQKFSKAQSSMQPQKERYHGFSLSWVVPFLKSLIDFGDFELPTIVELLTFVCCIHNVSLHGDTDISSTDLFQNVLPIESIAERLEKLFLPQESLSSISQSVGVLFSRKVYSALLDCKQTVFCMVTALCSHLLSKDNQLRNKHKPYLSQTARTYISLVMYCSTEKTARDLWYLLTMVSPLSPFQSVISTEKSAVSTINVSLLSQPADLSEVLLKMITDKLKERDDLSGPFLYPPSSTEGSKWFGSFSSVVVKQEPGSGEPHKMLGSDSKNTEVEQESVVDQCTSLANENPTSNETCIASAEEVTGNTARRQKAVVVLKPFNLQLKKLPVKRRVGDGYPVIVNESSDNEPDTVKHGAGVGFKLDLESDTESCSADDEDEDLPNYFSFSSRRRKHASAISSATSDDESCEEQKIVSSNESRIGVIQKRMSSSSTITLEDGSCEGSGVTKCVHKITLGFQDKERLRCTSTTSTITLDDEHHEGSGQNSSGVLNAETSNMHRQTSTAATLHSEASEGSKSNVQKIYETTSELSPLKKKIKMEDSQKACPGLNNFDNAKDTVADGSPTSSLNVKQTNEVVGNSVSLIDLMFSDITCQQKPTPANSNMSSTRPSSLPMRRASIKSEYADTAGKADEDTSTFASYEEDTNQDMNLSDGDDSDCFVVTPIKHENLRFEQKGSVKNITDEMADEAPQSDVVKSVSSNVQVLQPSPMQPVARKASLSDGKLQPAVVGRAPFSKSRMALLQTPEIEENASKSKGNSNKGIQKKVADSKSTRSASTTAGAPKVVVTVELSRSRDKEEFLMDVLQWSPLPFYQSRESSGIVPEGPHCIPTIQDVPLTFKSSNQYVEVFKPLLLLETWDTIADEIKHPDKTRRTIEAKIDDCNLCTPADAASPHHRLTCKALITTEESKCYCHPLERDLICICIMANSKYFPMMFGMVESSSKARSSDDIKQSSHASNQDVELTLRVSLNRCNGCFHFLSDNLDIQVMYVTSMSSFLRQWEGLVTVPKNMLCRDILHPRRPSYFGCFEDTQSVDKDKDYKIQGNLFNSSQFEAITMATKALSLAYCLPQIVLLQGPPGTGKTHTVFGLIMSFFAGHKESASSYGSALPGNRIKPPKPHLLVCAPSNAGVDVIVSRLLTEGVVVGTSAWSRRCELMKQNGSKDGLRVVRYGMADKIDSKVLPIALDEIVKKKTAENSKKLQSLESKIANMKKQLSKLDEQIAEAQRMVVTLVKSNSGDDLRWCSDELNSNVTTLRRDRQKLNSELRKLTNEQRSCSQDIKRIRHSVLTEADIICCTLTSSGSHGLREAFQSKPQYFTAVIVDEAAQCSELLTLIPLLYHSTKLVLVGDPAQLPATVKSMKAAKHGYGQSLFERLFCYFKSKDYLKYYQSPIKMLRLQYRMHSAICQFPSEKFYHGKLLTHSSCDEETFLKPLLVFDSDQSVEESRDGCSFSNALESKLIIEICSLLLRKNLPHTNIGIITPYRAQMKLIQSSLENRKFPKIEVGTVDSFQGREKDVILLSCVRVSTHGSIGFLKDCRRLNVAVTRAKRALYVVSHLNTFKGNKDWKMFIDHAEKQRLIVSVDKHMRCVQDCLNRELATTRNFSVLEKSNKVPQVPHRDNTSLPSSITPAGVVSFKEKHPGVDRLAFSSPRKGVQYVDPLPLSRKPAKKSTPIKSPTAAIQKQFFGSSTEQPVAESLLDSPVTPSKSKTTVDKQKSFVFTDDSSTFKTVNTVAKKLSGASRNVMQDLHSDHTPTQKATTVGTVSRASSGGTLSRTSTNVRSAVGESKVAGNTVLNAKQAVSNTKRNVVDYNMPSSSSWGGQRKRVSHFANRPHSDSVSKKVKFSK